MPRTKLALIVLADVLILQPLSAGAQQLENKTTPATSGTVDTASQGRTSGANLSAGDKGPASETRMPDAPQKAEGRGAGASRAGANPTTRELFQH